MKTFLSWDCANKTLAYCFITINTNIYSDINDIITEYNDMISEVGSGDGGSGEVGSGEVGSGEVGSGEGGSGDGGSGEVNNETKLQHISQMLSKIKTLHREFVTFHSYKVTDILEGRRVQDCSEVERAKSLKKFLENSDVSIEKLPSDTTILIEHQPSKVGFAANNKSTHISSMLAFYYTSFDTHLVDPKLKNKITIAPGYDLPTYIGGTNTTYAARKKHTKESFVKYLTDIRRLDVIKGVKKFQLDDLADSFFQVFGYLQYGIKVSKVSKVSKESNVNKEKKTGKKKIKKEKVKEPKRGEIVEINGKKVKIGKPSKYGKDAGKRDKSKYNNKK